MHTDDAQLWSAIEERLGYCVPEDVRDVARASGLVTMWLRSTDHRQRQNILLHVLSMVETMAERDLFLKHVRPKTPPREQERTGPTRGEDGRWWLWSKLVSAVRDARQVRWQDFWQPITFRRIIDITDHPLISHRVEVSFDSRMSLAALIKELKAMWGRLEDDRWVRPRRPLDKRKLELVDFVCLRTDRSMTWSQRCAAWNQSHKGREYAHYSSMHSDFRKAEENLTGHKHGLGWFYEDGIDISDAEQFNLRDSNSLWAWAAAGGDAALSKKRMDVLRPLTEVIEEYRSREIAQAIQAIKNEYMEDDGEWGVQDADRRIGELLDDVGAGEGLDEYDDVFVPDLTLGPWRIEQ